MKALVIVDFQRDFVDGTLGFAKAKTLDQLIYNKILKAREEGTKVFFTFDTHQPDYLDSHEGSKLPIPHCIIGSEGWEIYGKTGTLCDDNVVKINKPTFGSFELGEELRKGNFSQVELVGVVTNICVISNAIIAKAALPEAEIIIDESCTASYDEELHHKAIDVMKGLYFTII